MFHQISPCVLERMQYLEEFSPSRIRLHRAAPGRMGAALGLIRQLAFAARYGLGRVAGRGAQGNRPRRRCLNQISPEEGRFLALLAASAPEGVVLEIGTSAGYSTLWISLACELLGRRITTFEISPERAEMARETFQAARRDSIVTLVEGDARQYLRQYENVAFCFLDAEKTLYGEFYETVVPRLVTGGLLVADNAGSHREERRDDRERVL